MKMKAKRTTRREFLKQSAGFAGTVMLAGCGTAKVLENLAEAPGTAEKQATGKGRAHYKVFSEGIIGDMRIKNRFVRTATMISAASNGNPSDTYLEMHRELAAGGVGLLITGFMLPSKSDALNPRQIHVCDDRHIKGLKSIADAVHEADSACKLVAQIGHSGAFVSPSGINWPWTRKGKELTTEEVDAIVTDFAEATRRAQEAGFDGVELHGAHGYLLSSFLSPYTNKRTDKYGGSLQERVHIVRATMDQARQRVGSEFPILIRLNSNDVMPGGIRPDNFSILAKEVEETGVDAIDVSGNDPIKADIDTVEEETYFLEGARAAKVDIPLIVTGGNRTIDHMEGLLKQNGIGFFGMSRPLIREADLPNRWLAAQGDASATCISCNGCFGAIMRGETAYCVQEN